VAGHEPRYITARLSDQAERRAKFGNSACMQEPNIKNGCGGLRDYQNLLWMSFFKYRTRSLAELEKHELVMPRERKQLEAAYDFLLRVRTQLHYLVPRPSDALTKNLQPSVASNLGYGDRSPSKRIEKFMRDLYTHSRTSSRARWSSAWRSSKSRPRAFPSGVICPKARKPSRWMDSNSSTARYTRRATVSSAINRAV
jgi:UTP:GlnB (protein PII) uridylyltransferase